MPRAIRTPRLKGTPGSNVHYTLPDGTEGDVTLDEDGKADVEVGDPQPEGGIHAYAENPDTGEKSDEVVVNYNPSSDSQSNSSSDTTPPDAPLIGAIKDDDGNAITGDTNDTKPKIKGTGEPGSLITLYDEKDNVVGQGTVGSNGHYSIELTAALAEGTHNLTATATDASGNESAEVA
ncbi:Ig-like domain-containing protein [Martelella sp. FLE1502]